MLKFINGSKRFLPVLSGILIGSSFIPFPPWAALFCFVPLWLFWQRQSCLKAVFWSGMTTAFVLTLVGCNWMTYLLHEFAHLPWFLAVIGMILYAFVANCYIPLAGVLWFLIKRHLDCHEWHSLSLLTLITILSAAYTPTLFDWNIGYSWFAAGFPLYHLAEIIGFSGLSALTMGANFLAYFAWQGLSQKREKRLLLILTLSFALLNLTGAVLNLRLSAPDGQFNVLMVQGNIGNSEKLAAELGENYSEAIFNQYLHLTHDALIAHANEKIDFIIWPETAFPTFLGDNILPQNDYAAQLKEFLQLHHVALITGAYGVGVQKAERMLTNSLFLLNDAGEVTTPHYSKTRLLAFGEYIPLEDVIPQIRAILPPIGRFARGQGATMLFQWHDLKIGPQICYESLFTPFAKELASLGANVIINVANDSWYGWWQEPYQHLYMTMAKAVEFRRPVVRVTNTGISSVSLATGHLIEQSPIDQAWTHLYHVPYTKTPTPTFYQEWFYLVPCILWLSLAGLIFVCMRKKPAKQS